MKIGIFYPCQKFGEYCNNDNVWNTIVFWLYKFGKNTLAANLINDIL